MSVAFVNARDWQRESTSFAGLAMINNFTTTGCGGGDPVLAELALVGEDYWKVFPTQSVQGRLTNHEDHVPGAAPVVVVNRPYWQNELGGRPLGEYSLEILGFPAEVCSSRARRGWPAIRSPPTRRRTGTHSSAREWRWRAEIVGGERWLDVRRPGQGGGY